jgi:hypothetical protein
MVITGCAQLGQFVHAREHLIGRNGLGEIVVLIAILAGQIAAANRNNVRQQTGGP